MVAQNNKMFTNDLSTKRDNINCNGWGIRADGREFCDSSYEEEWTSSQLRARDLLMLPIEYVESPDFSGVENSPEQDPLFDPQIEQILKRSESPQKKSRRQTDYDPYVWLMPDEGNILLSRTEEVILFRRFNLLKYRAYEARKGLDLRAPSEILMDRIETLLEDSVRIKNFLISTNLRLVVSVAKKYSSPLRPIHELISDGNISLIRAVEKFDYTKGYKFSTYASWALFRNFARSIPEELRYQERFHPTEQSIFEACVEEEPSLEKERLYKEQILQVSNFMNELDDRERVIIQRRYGLGIHRVPQTLRQVGSALGVTKERVRQIETRAIAKMRKIAHERRLEIPELF